MVCPGLPVTRTFFLPLPQHPIGLTHDLVPIRHLHQAAVCRKCWFLDLCSAAALLDAAGRRLPKAARARRGGNGLGRDEVEILVIGDFIKAIPVLQQLTAEILVDLRSEGEEVKTSSTGTLQGYRFSLQQPTSIHSILRTVHSSHAYTVALLIRRFEPS